MFSTHEASPRVSLILGWSRSGDAIYFLRDLGNGANVAAAGDLMKLKIARATGEPRGISVDLAREPFVALPGAAALHEVLGPRVHLPQVRVATGDERAHEVQGRGGGVVDLDEPLRVRLDALAGLLADEQHAALRMPGVRSPDPVRIETRRCRFPVAKGGSA